ncbi:MAG: hypothetical protein M0Z40_10390 [Actinomycetota bacterium]|jgi:hypothetical protein|nr:hypothetical protein [Actinomycetota bacterium]
MIEAMVNAPPRPVIFLTDSFELEETHVDAERRLLRTGSELLALVGAATASGETVLMRIGPSLGDHVLGIPARVHLGPRWTRNGCAAIALRWEAALFDSLFPVLDGTLIISPLGTHRSRVTIEASYRPPLEGIGALLDRAILHRVARSTVHEFLQQLGAALSLDAEPATFEPATRAQRDTGALVKNDRGAPQRARGPRTAEPAARAGGA